MYKYSHKCKARAPDEAPPEPKPEHEPSAVRGGAAAKSKPEPKPKPERKKVNVAKLTADLKPALTTAQSTRPVKQKAVIQRTPEYSPPEPPYQPNQAEIYSHLMQQRQLQAALRHQAMMAPYQHMFGQRAQ